MTDTTHLVQEDDVKTYTPAELLDLPLGDNDIDAETIRGYLVGLLEELWEKREGFSGKRPFGNSGWEYCLYTALVKASAVTGKLVTDESGWAELVSCDDAAADQCLLEAIGGLYNERKVLPEAQ